MYIGSTGERGLHHLIWEIIDNGVDESIAGYCDQVIVLTLQADGSVRVEDNGRGIPTDTAPGQEMPALTMALTMLHAGGKFGGGGYKVSGGLHGVGVSVVNALSTHLHAEVSNRGHLWRQTFSLGVPDGELEQVRHAWRRASAPARPSPGGPRRTSSSHDVQPRDHHLRLREMAFLNKGVEIVVRDERERRRRPRRRGRATTPSTPASTSRRTTRSRRRRPAGSSRSSSTTAASSTTSSTSTGARTRPTPRHLLRGGDRRGRLGPHMSLEVAMQWNTSYTESVHTFANNDQHPRGRHPRGGLPLRAHLPGQQLGRGVGADQEEGGPGLG